MNTQSSFTVEKTAVLMLLYVLKYVISTWFPWRNVLMFVFGRVWLHNGVLQNSNVTKQYVLQKWYALQNGTCYKRYVWQNGTRYKTVPITNRYMLQNGAR
jgi:hypothetical protein